MIVSIKHRGLRLLFTKGDRSKVRAAIAAKADGIKVERYRLPAGKNLQSPVV